MGFYARKVKLGEKVKRGDYEYAFRGSHIMVPAKELLGCKLQSGDPEHFRPLKKMPKAARQTKGSPVTVRHKAKQKETK